MPRLALGTRALSSYSGDTVVIGLTAAKPTKTSRKKASTAPPQVVTSVELGDELAKGVAAAVEVLDPSTAVGATTVAPAPAGLKARKLLLVGLGDGEVTTDSLRRAAGSAARACAKDSSIRLLLPHDDASGLAAIADGALGGAYTFTAHKSKPTEATHRDRHLARPLRFPQGRPRPRRDARTRGRLGP